MLHPVCVCVLIIFANVLLFELIVYYVVLCMPYSVIAAYQIPILGHSTQQLTVI